jgi:acetyltransferase-like isoleucine patch superfamily enzyme/acyl carrier protein
MRLVGVTASTHRAATRLRLPEVASIAVSFARARFELRSTRRGPRVRCFGALDIPQRDGIVVGEKAVFLGGPIPTSLRCAPGAEIVVGERTVCNYGVAVTASSSVRIGSECMIASFVHIRDSDGRRTSPVVIGKGVWIAHGAVIEPGSVVGDGAVVATMAVVSGTVPPRSLAAGNPARWIPLEATALPTGPGLPAADAAPVSHSPEEARAAIMEWLDDTRLFGEAERLVTSDTMPLREHGLLDSLGTVELLRMLEKRFGVEIDRERAMRPEAQSLKVFVELVTHPGPRGP